MVDFKLANLLIEVNERFRNFPKIFVRSHGAVVAGENDGELILSPYADYDFTTYFNSISIAKWKEYTCVRNVILHLEIKGKVEIRFHAAKKRSIGSVQELVEKVRIESMDDFKAIDFEFPDDPDAVLFGFNITTFEPTVLRNGYYYAKVDENDIRDVRLCLATTTFGKEDYIASNVALFKNDIRQCGDPVADNAYFVVVDNGRTLDASDLQGDGVYVFPNKNVGGSGGFARGMIEARRLDPRPTHVLIMDDDIELSSESIKRTFNLLSLVKDEYASAFVSGAMFSLGDQMMQIEDVGCAMSNGKFGPIKKRLNMDFLWDIIRNEDPLPMRTNRYAAFWYCCIPMETIDEMGLPLPLFIRYDDAEYGMRCNPKFMTMNGINVWHLDFIDRYSPFYERYCGMRNALVIQATTGVCQGINYMSLLFENTFKKELKKFNYGSCELLLDAVEDYLRGPECIAEERCEEILKEKSKKMEKLQPLDKLDLEDVSLDGIDDKSGYNFLLRNVDRVTLNGQFFVPKALRSNELQPVRYNPNAYNGIKLHFRSKILAVDRLDEKGVVREVDPKRAHQLMRRYKHLRRQYILRHEEVEAQYAAAKDWLVSEEFWKGYLGID